MICIFERPPHELPRLVRCVGRLRGGCFWLESWTTPTIPPDPQYREPMPEDLVSQRCAWPQACRAMATASIDSTYCVGSGLSWKPIAAAFRFSAFNTLAFTLASYSSIDCVTYSWPYLSIR